MQLGPAVVSNTVNVPDLNSNMTQQNTIVEEKYKNGSEWATRKYIKGKFLGKGGFAKCWEFINSDTDYVHAAKIIQKSSLTKSRAKQKLMSEIKIHRSIKHNHVC